MKVIVNNKESELNARHLTIIISEDVEVRVHINNQNQLVLVKTQLGSGETSMIISPAVSNEIRIS